MITFQKKKRFILLTEVWTGNVSLKNGAKDAKTFFDSTKTILYKTDKVAAPNNIKPILDGSIEKIKNVPFNIKSLASLRIVHENFFLHYNENMVVETYLSKLNRNMSSQGVVSFLGKQTDLENKLHHTRTKTKI